MAISDSLHMQILHHQRDAVLLPTRRITSAGHSRVYSYLSQASAVLKFMNESTSLFPCIRITSAYPTLCRKGIIISARLSGQTLGLEKNCRTACRLLPTASLICHTERPSLSTTRWAWCNPLHGFACSNWELLLYYLVLAFHVYMLGLYGANFIQTFCAMTNYRAFLFVIFYSFI